MLNFINFQGLLKRILRTFYSCSQTLKVLCSGCPTFPTLGKGSLAQIPADTWLLLKLAPLRWQPQVAPHGPWFQMAPGMDQAPVKSAFVGAAVSQTCSFCQRVTVLSGVCRFGICHACKRLKWQCNIFLIPSSFRTDSFTLNMRCFCY